VVKTQPEERCKEIVITHENFETFTIAIYLSQEAECTLVEKSRKPQPDKIEYDLICAEPILGALDTAA
jgi:hypothetical protein